MKLDVVDVPGMAFFRCQVGCEPGRKVGVALMSALTVVFFSRGCVPIEIDGLPINNGYK